MYEELFADRLAVLRAQKNVSAREMSLAIGQNASYINRIENGKSFPSMQCFFYICEYLNVTPCEFFDMEVGNPRKNGTLSSQLHHLSDSQLDAISNVVDCFLEKNEEKKRSGSNVSFSTIMQ